LDFKSKEKINNMSHLNVVVLTEQEILSIPNNYDLGEHVRKKLWDMNHPPKIKSKIQPKKDKCVICGKDTPYLETTHIYLRVGYVEGGGQGCFQPTVCK
jgi:hypothetical protein